MIKRFPDQFYGGDEKLRAGAYRRGGGYGCLELLFVAQIVAEKRRALQRAMRFGELFHETLDNAVCLRLGVAVAAP